MKEALHAVEMDPALNNRDLDVAATEIVGQMHDPQGIDGSHNSGDLTVIGPASHGSMPGDHNSQDFGCGGFGPVS